MHRWRGSPTWTWKYKLNVLSRWWLRPWKNLKENSVTFLCYNFSICKMGRATELTCFWRCEKWRCPISLSVNKMWREGEGLIRDLQNTGESGTGPAYLYQEKSSWQKLDNQGSGQSFVLHQPKTLPPRALDPAGPYEIPPPLISHSLEKLIYLRLSLLIIWMG